MNKLVLLFLLITGTATYLPAQPNRINALYYLDSQGSPADAMFNRPSPGKARVNFHFFSLPNNTRITFELVTIKQLNHLPSLDSLLVEAGNAIKHLADSFTQDALSRRVDVLLDGKTAQVRITTHQHPGTFVVKDGELNALKVAQDTLRIKFYAATGKQYKNNNTTDANLPKYMLNPAFITVITNNLQNVNDLPANTLQQCLAMLRQDISEGYVNAATENASYTAYYNMQAGKRFSPTNPKWIKYGRYRNELVPNIYGSLQFTRGTLAPSMAAGLRFTTGRSASGYKRLYLMWDPYFFFSRNANNKLVTDRNDFVTFRYVDEFMEKKNGEFDLLLNFSVGYLTRRSGEWFEKNTFKFSLPAVRSGWLQFEPEFYFNDLFKNFSPTIKLTLHYE
jgi:hypothetical protein